MNQKLFLYIVACIVTCQNFVINATPSHVLTLFLDWYPSIEKAPTEYPEGIIVTYYGNKKTTNSDGQVIFPLYQQLPSVKKGKKLSLYVMVCPSIDPRMLIHATVDRFTLPQNTPYELYVIEKIYDKETQSYLWITKKAHLNNDIIPLKTIVIHADPSDIIIRPGATVTDNSPHILLPTLLIKKTFDPTPYALKFLQHSQFFGPVNRHVSPTINETTDTKASING